MLPMVTKKILILSSIFLLAAGCGKAATNPQTQSAQPTAPTSKTYTMAEVEASNKPEKCWTVIRGDVYDLTAWINKHPGGDKNILKLCGVGGTQAFEKKHGGQEKPENALKGFEIGKLK